MLGYAPMLPVVEIHVSEPEMVLLERLLVESDHLCELSLSQLSPPPWA
jgi:hypothetical protein